MDAEGAEQRYLVMGLTVRRFDDEPGHVYRYHHHEATYLYTLTGIGLMKLQVGDVVTYHLVPPGSELLVDTDVLHGGVAGPDGWSYLAASASQPSSGAQLPE